MKLLLPISFFSLSLSILYAATSFSHRPVYQQVVSTTEKIIKQSTEEQVEEYLDDLDGMWYGILYEPIIQLDSIDEFEDQEA